MSTVKQILTLHDASLDILKPLFLLSSTLNKSNNTINFSVSPKGLHSSNKNHAMSVVKTWNLNFEQCCSSTSGVIPEKLKISIFEGVDFAKKILAYFGQVATIEIHHDGLSASKIVLKKMTKEGKLSLKIDVVCASVDISYFEYSAEELLILFGDDENFVKKEVFNLSKDNIQNIKKLLKLQTNPEEQKKYIRIYSKDGIVMASDDGFDLALFDDVNGQLGETIIEIDKSIFITIDDSSYSCVYSSFTDDSDKMELLVLNATSTAAIRRTSLNLLQDISSATDSINWSEFEDTDNGFN